MAASDPATRPNFFKKSMKVPRGTARRKRRLAALALAQERGVMQKYFPLFWYLGANEQAASETVRQQFKGGHEK